MSWLLNLLSGGLFNSISTTINNITKAISDEKIAQINATSDVQKTQIQAKIDQLQSQRDVLIADANAPSGWVDTSIRALFAVPPGLYFAKLFIWDKVIGSWPNYSTDRLSDNDLYVVLAVLGFYFLYSTAKIFK